MPSLNSFQNRQVFLNSISSGEATPALSTAWLSQPASGVKSKGRAFLLSLLLPGWGQYYARSNTMVKVFVASEALLWGTYAGFTVWSNWLEDDYRTFAVTHARVNLEGKSANYFVDIGNFDDISEYNQAQLRNRDIDGLYPETEEFFWQWDSEASRSRFEDLRIRSDRAANRADLTVAMIFVNHLVSALQATLAVHRYNQRQSRPDIGMNLEFAGTPENRQLKLQLLKHF